MVETGLRFERLRALFTVYCIVVPISVTITWLHYSSIPYVLVQFPNINILSAKSHNFTAIISNEEDIAIGMKVKDQSITPQPGQKYESHCYTEEHSSTDDEDNELFDGLLVSTFDRGSCLSRHESHLYRKTSPHKPCQHLKSKLCHYEQLHRSCAACFSFIRNHSKSNSSNNHASAINCKCLIWTAMDGLGNRMLSLVSAFLYALLTDRVLLVKFESNMDGLFCEPFPNSSWLLPRDCSHKELSDLSVLHLRHTNDDHYAFFHCGSTQDLLQNVPVLILQSNQYFVPSLFMIPSFRQDLTKMFPEKDTIFHLLGNYLFHPSNIAWKFISNFYQTHLSMATQKIGLQIRLFDTQKESHQVVLNKILACTSKNNLLPQSDGRTSVTSTPSQNHNTSRAVLVISLYSEYGNKLKATYMANTSVSNEVIRIYPPSHEENKTQTTLSTT